MKALDYSQIKPFILGGKAIFTIKNEVSGGHMTFKVSLPKGADESAPYFASVLNGSDNYTNYAYMGILSTKGGKLSLVPTKGSKVGQQSKAWKSFVWLCNNINNRSIPETVHVYHEGKCGKCGKKLTVPESIESGFGPECSKMLGI